MSDDENRRPLASRDTGIARRITRYLASTRLSPNQISVASIVAAALAALGFFAASQVTGITQAVLLLFSALFCQLRLLCNLFDGMVAVEAGKRTSDGVAWNEFPDRFSDILIFVGIGFAIDLPELGWTAATFSVLTAYVREHGAAVGQGHDFVGPMAKQHRMAVVTFAALIGATGMLSFYAVLSFALWVVVIGALFTSIRRIHRLLLKLNSMNV